VTTAMRRVVTASSSRHLSDSGIKQLVLAYKAKGANGVVEEAWSPKPGFIYASVRAISARVNQNFDAWPSHELKKAYRSFLGKPNFVNHQNFDPKKARGKVVAARYVEAGDDRYVETILEVDAQRFPKLAKEIREGGIDSVSMGVEAGLTKCSVCGNEATDEPEFCDHVRHHKGEYLKDTRTGERKLCYEDCFKLGFFELSWVFDPADETAVTSRVMVASKTAADRRRDDLLLDIEETDDPMGGKDDTDYSSYVTQAPADVSDPYSYPAPSDGGSSISAPSGGGGDYAPSGGIEQWRDEVELGLTRNGLPTSLSDQVLHQIETESSGNPEAINNWDSNAAKGTPSKGLLQTIDPTYQQYKLPGAGDDPFNPQDNVDAAINYAKETYGPSLVNDSGNGLGSGHGYDQGGFVPEGTSVVHNDTGAPELIIPLKGKYSPFDSEFEEPETRTGQRVASRRHAYGETTAPEDVDTLRDDEDDSLDDYDFVEPVDINPEEENPFQHYLQSPPELSGPNFDDAARLDRQQEHEGLDADRRVEDFGDIDGDPDFEDAPPRRMTMSRTRTRRHAADEEAVEALEEALDEDLDGDAEEGEPEEHQDAVLDDDDSGDDDEDYADNDHDDADHHAEDCDDDAPPWVDERAAQRRPVRNRRSARNKGKATKGADMSLAQRAKVANQGRRQHFADTSGHTDGGPYGNNDSQGELEQAYITEVPDGEAVVAPTPGDGTISNTEGNLVAHIKTKSADLQRDIRAYQQMTARKRRPYRETATFVASLPANQRVAAAQSFAQTFKAENPRFSPAKFFAAVGLDPKFAARITADAVEQADKVDPPLSGTDEQSLAGDDFDNVALDDVETQPKDASVKAFAAFDRWLTSTTGKTAAQHSPNWLRRQAARWAQSKGIAVQALYPTLGNVLRQARKTEGPTRKAPMNRRHAEDTSLEVAAPQGRVDVEAPVDNDTDADAQASQYDLGDFGHNAGDDIADPELSSDSQIWAPGEKSARKADGVAAVRYAEAVIKAGLAPADDRWKLAAQAQTMRHAVVTDRTKLLEAVAATNASHRVTAAVSRGPRNPIPPGITAAGRTASTRRVAEHDPANDASLFI